MMKFNPKEFDFQGIIYNNENISCKEFKRAIFSLTEKIKKNTQKNRSPFIYLVAVNHPKTIIAYFAILQAEFSCVLIDPDWKTLEWEYMLSDTPPSAVFRINLETSYNDFEGDIEYLPDNPDAIFEDKRGYTIVYTAAEGGYAKGALLSQHNILTDALSHVTTNDAGVNDTICSLLPLSHLFGLTIGVVAPILSHSRMLIENVKNLHALESILIDIKEFNVSYLYTIPVLLFLLGNTPRAKENSTSLKLVTTGGCKLPESIFSNFKRKFNLEIHEGYGLTEAAPVCSWHHPSDTIKPASIGTPFSCCKFKVINSSGDILTKDTIGELCVQGGHVMEGYYRKPETNRKVLNNGWLHTGDKGKIDSDGYIYITGLIKNMVSVGGRNVYPEELKRMLLYNENVDHVDLVFSEPTLTGTKISANITLKKKSPELQNEFMKWCIQNIAAYKLPKIWEFTN